ncbi:hypothetical protein AC579_7750 [Pseudocercospora musae]|uniref:Prolyl 4-hydroxylase alpha subunit domain-containing protein n=1 Tax=Pseudocercospora musae TaxID=113226 RepID=A0A139IJU4_9PEZI|nr:hypothetical protein AC579_7750 [Pseudocercospora musae]
MEKPKAPPAHQTQKERRGPFKMDKYMHLQLVLFAAIIALLVPLYHPLDHIQRLINLTPFGSSDRPLKLPKLEKISPKTRFMSYDPLIAHLEDLISYEERQYLLKLSKPLLRKSQVRLNNGTKVDSPNRTSSTAFLPRTDPVVTHILERASEFQGYIPIEQIDMQVTAYQPGQHYRAHYDWFPSPTMKDRNRFSTFFAILDADCTNCGTEFPHIALDIETLDLRWCSRINCTADVVTSLNIPGHAVFWRNLDPWGLPREDVLHAGLPAVNGSKIGLNIWTEITVNPEWYPSPDEILPSAEDLEEGETIVLDDEEESEQEGGEEQGSQQQQQQQRVLESSVS